MYAQLNHSREMSRYKYVNRVLSSFFLHRTHNRSPFASRLHLSNIPCPACTEFIVVAETQPPKLTSDEQDVYHVDTI